ncbi:uncharacterized protein L201_007544 [Kwoniella dendrophila CBS 6074]|uniref:WSC domain-containing protein n=1 Tax=Kwoniella dendrophila CBS 6074 TaxID=1295534 RepID=A0AAX4K703_9TREE
MFAYALVPLIPLLWSPTTMAAPTSRSVSSGYRWVSNGCLLDSWNRALGAYQYIDEVSMTTQSCQTTCQGKGYTYAGVEYGNQCFCDNYVTYGEWSSGASAAEADCNDPCVGNTTENCGGDWRLRSFRWTNEVEAVTPSSTSTSATSSTTSTAASSDSSSVASSTTSSTASASSSTTAASASATAVPSGWSKSSNPCIAEGTSGRALAGASFASSSMTWTQCINHCQDAGFTIAGLEYSSECYCGNILSNGASLTKTSSSCYMECSGNSLTTCGGPSALSLFVSDAALSTLSADLTSKNLVLSTGWSAASTACIAEGSSGRALDSASFAGSAMTVNKCLNFCQGKGYQYAGLEYSSECYCGDSLVNGGSLSISSSNCNMLCSGDDTSFCGGSNALQLYQNPSLAQELTLVDNYKSQGCIQEVSGRALTGASLTGSDMTIDKCVTYCAQEGFTYAGLEYASECYCGNTLSNGAAISSYSNQCNMACAGNSAEVCGGPNAISLWKA